MGITHDVKQLEEHTEERQCLAEELAWHKAELSKRKKQEVGKNNWPEELLMLMSSS